MSERAAIVVARLGPAASGDMGEEAASAGFDTSNELGPRKYPRIQLFTLEGLLNGKKVDCPPFVAGQGNVTFRRAPVAGMEDRSKTKASSIHELEDEW